MNSQAMTDTAIVDAEIKYGESGKVSHHKYAHTHTHKRTRSPTHAHTQKSTRALTMDILVVGENDRRGRFMMDPT